MKFFKKIKENPIQMAIILLGLVIVIMAVYRAGKLAGMREYQKSIAEVNAANEEADCWMDYFVKPQEDIPARCLKYLE